MKCFVLVLAIAIHAHAAVVSNYPTRSVTRGLSPTPTPSMAPDCNPSANGPLPPFPLPRTVTVCLRPGTPFQETVTAERARATCFLKSGARLGQCTAPLPATAASGLPVDFAKGYFVGPVKPCASASHCAYVITDGVYNMMFLTTGAGVIVIDAPPTITGAGIMAAIREKTSEPITHVIYSHAHADHIGAANVYPASATIISHVDTVHNLQRVRPFPYGIASGGTFPRLPTQTITDSLTLTVGTQTVQITTSPAAHESGNLFIYLPADKILMYVDIIFPGWSMFNELAVSQDVLGFIQVHDTILNFDFDALVTGHVNRLATREDVLIQKQYVNDLVQNAGIALSSVSFGAVGQQVGFQNVWLAFQTYNDLLGELCTDLTLDVWRDRLGATDVFTRSHCDRIIESMRID